MRWRIGPGRRACRAPCDHSCVARRGIQCSSVFADRIVSFHIFDFSRRAFKPPEREVIPLGRYVFCLSTAEWVAVRAHTRVRVAACLFWLKLRSISGCDRAAGGEQICDCKSTPLSRSTSQINIKGVALRNNELCGGTWLGQAGVPAEPTACRYAVKEVLLSVCQQF